MLDRSKFKRTYKVTCVVHVEAGNVRHAAHIARGVMQMRDSGPSLYTVEECLSKYGEPYKVDLTKKLGERGYLRRG